MLVFLVLQLLVSTGSAPATTTTSTSATTPTSPPVQGRSQAVNRLAEYLPGSDVTLHSRLDLDQVICMEIDFGIEEENLHCHKTPLKLSQILAPQKDFMDFLSDKNFKAANQIYTKVCTG